MDPGYWGNVAAQFRRSDEIIVKPDNGAWRLHLQVFGADRLWAQVARIAFVEFEQVGAPVALPSRFAVDFKGDHHKWRVLRDGAMIKDGFESEDLARRYAANSARLLS